MTAFPDSIRNLVNRFRDNIENYRSGKYNETQVRREFIDPFFKALGWDIDNSQGYAEWMKDVIHEDAIEVDGGLKAPDYSFRVGGTRIFFLEAKKPSVNIKDDQSPAFQLRRYGWSAKLPISVLTDFEEFAVYDCRIRPVKGDKAAIARVFYCRFDEYESRWDEIASVFSKDAVMKGSFHRFIENDDRKKGTETIDKAFLKEIEGWRDLLASNIALRNGNLNEPELNDAVQKTIDRIVFLRICEDRGLEPYGILKETVSGPGAYDKLKVLYRKADERYNSGLFHFSEEKGREGKPDMLSVNLSIDDKVLKDIILHLYYPDSSFVFSQIPSDILGQIYEKFLGKVISLSAGHRAKIEEKPEVRKAGGVFYTPTFIVDYIVKAALDPLLLNKKPADLISVREALKHNTKTNGKEQGTEITGGGSLRILDPACGSGTFLIQAYQHLLDWYLTNYTSANPEKLSKGGNPLLYIKRKRRVEAYIAGAKADSD